MEFFPYESRFKAGEILARFVLKENKEIKNQVESKSNDFFVFAIPNGGVPIAEGFCNVFDIKYDLMIVRKIKIPFNPEAGFGAVAIDGTALFNQDLLNYLNLSSREIDETVQLTKSEIDNRLKVYSKSRLNHEYFSMIIENKNIFLIDDGLASGFTMLAAIKMVKKYKPLKIFIAVPTSPYKTILRLSPEIDHIFCPNIRRGYFFAVANAYRNWYDVPESEVLDFLKKSNHYYSKSIEKY